MRWLCLVSLFVCLAGCATSRYYGLAVRSWSGASARSLIKRWGHPNRIIHLKNHHRLYVYHFTRHGQYPVVGMPSYATVPMPGKMQGGGRYRLTCTTWFEINRSSRVIGSSFRGNDCAASKAFLASYGR